MASKRPVSPLTSRNSQNSATRRSFTRNPFSRPNALLSPNSENPSTIRDYMAGSPAKGFMAPTISNALKLNPSTRRKILGDGRSVRTSVQFVDKDPVLKENHKNMIHSPSKTISAASKYTPSPRRKILGDKKNEIVRTSGHFVDKNPVLKPEEKAFDDQIKSTLVFEKANPGDQVTLISTTDENKMLSDVTEDTRYVRVRPFCCSPVTSPTIAPDSLPPRPQFLRYKPNPRLNKDGSDDTDVTRLDASFSLSDTEEQVEVHEEEKNEADLVWFRYKPNWRIIALLNKHGSDEYGDDNDVTRLDDSFIMSDTEAQVEVHEEEKREAQLGESVHGSSESVSEIASHGKESETKVEKVTNPRFFTRSNTVTVSFVFLMFLVACFSVSFTDLSHMDLPTYENVAFIESFDDYVHHVRRWSINLVSYLSDQKSQFFLTHEINQTVSPPQEEFVLNRHIGTDCIHEAQEVEEELETENEMMEAEESYEEMEVHNFDEMVEIETDEQVHFGDVETNFDSEDILETQPEMLSNDPEFSSVDPVPEAQPEMWSDVREVESTVSCSVDAVPQVLSEVVTDGREVQSSSETVSSLSSQRINTIHLAGVSIVLLASALAGFYMKKTKSMATNPANGCVSDADMCTESYSAKSSSAQKGFKKKRGYKKGESLASSLTDLSMGYPSYGSFTTYETINPGYLVLLTRVRRSRRLNKSQVTSS